MANRRKRRLSGVLIEVRGVLAKDNGAAVGEMSPIALGLSLLQEIYRRWRLALSWPEKDEEAVRQWLLINGVLREQIAYVFTGEDFIRHLERFRALSPLAYVITASPANAAEAVKVGVPALVFAHPQYARPEFRPDGPPGVRKWEEIEDEVTKQRLLHAEDARLEE